MIISINTNHFKSHIFRWNIEWQNRASLHSYHKLLHCLIESAKLCMHYLSSYVMHYFTEREWRNKWNPFDLCRSLLTIVGTLGVKQEMSKLHHCRILLIIVGIPTSTKKSCCCTWKFFVYLIKIGQSLKLDNPTSHPKIIYLIQWNFSWKL